MEKQNEPVRPRAVSSLSPHNEALYEVGKRMLAESLDVGREFSKFMIPVSSGAIPIYFGLLGLSHGKPLPSLLYLIPPIAFLIAVVLFVLSYFPRQGEYSLEVLEEIEEARKRAINGRNAFLFSGLAAFLSGTAVFIGITAKLYQAPPSQRTRIQVVSVLVPANASAAEAKALVERFDDQIGHMKDAQEISYHELKVDAGVLLIANIHITGD